MLLYADIISSPVVSNLVVQKSDFLENVSLSVQVAIYQQKHEYLFNKNATIVASLRFTLEPLHHWIFVPINRKQEASILCPLSVPEAVLTMRGLGFAIPYKIIACNLYSTS